MTIIASLLLLLLVPPAAQRHGSRRVAGLTCLAVGGVACYALWALWWTWQTASPAPGAFTSKGPDWAELVWFASPFLLGLPILLVVALAIGGCVVALIGVVLYLNHRDPDLGQPGLTVDLLTLLLYASGLACMAWLWSDDGSNAFMQQVALAAALGSAALAAWSGQPAQAQTEARNISAGVLVIALAWLAWIAPATFLFLGQWLGATGRTAWHYPVVAAVVLGAVCAVASPILLLRAWGDAGKGKLNAAALAFPFASLALTWNLHFWLQWGDVLAKAQR